MSDKNIRDKKRKYKFTKEITKATLSLEEKILKKSDNIEDIKKLIETYHKDFKFDCLNYDYIPASLPAVNRIIAIGDIHGDLELAKKYLLVGKVIDDNFNWIGGDTVVVQVGDQIDRCRPYKYTCKEEAATVDDEGSDIKIMELFTELHEKAKKQGGAVYSLLGNHEMMNVEGNFNYVSKKGIDQFKGYTDPNNKSVKFDDGAEGRRYAFKRGNQYAKFMACTRVAALVVGSFLFVHAGIMPSLAKKYNLTKIQDFETLNYIVRSWLLGKLTKDNIGDIINSEKLSPFWPRILGSIPPDMKLENEDCQKYVAPVLNLFHLNGIIIGHTPQFYANNHGLNTTCGNTLWRVDIGASKAFDVFDSEMKDKTRKIQVLEILNDNKLNILS